MHTSKLESLQRREFLRRTAALGLAGTAGNLALSLAGIGEAAAQNAPTDGYKALVCVFLYGGNDHDNTFVPYNTDSHNVYQTLRDFGDAKSNIYVPKTNLTLLQPTSSQPTSSLPLGQQYAVQAAMGQMASLFNVDRKMGVLLNVGPLVKPTNKTHYTSAKTGDLPPKLFSHNDQFSLWQSGLIEGAEGATQGWGGRLGDLFLNSDNKSAHLTCINTAGNAVFMSGKNVLPYQVTSKGAVAINSLNFSSGVYGIAACKTALGTLLETSPSHWMEKEWARMMNSSIGNYQTVTTGLNPSSASDYFTTPFGADKLSAQLQIIARMIQARSNFAVKRQVFFVSLGGFDHHDGLKNAHAGAGGNGGLLKMVNDAMNSFYKATEQLNIQNQVTTFTASDFGRTLSSNGDGSDHGWGSHHMVMGGAVDGGKFWGTAPNISTKDDALNGPDTVGQGRLLPSTSVDEFAAVLARWMGVTDPDKLATVLPNLKSFEISGRSRLALFN
jgi:uncharacterized protein (DUF1501 family)